MGIYQELIDFNELFHTATKTPLIVNDFNETSELDKEDFNKLIYTKFNGDMVLSNIPTCDCGEVMGEFNIGVLCKNCMTVVSPVIEQTIEPLLWIRAPKDIRALINPTVWTMLTERFSPSGFDIIRWLTDTSYKPQVKTPQDVVILQEQQVPRGFNNFVDNFDAIMNLLFSIRKSKSKRDEVEPLQELLNTYRHCVFTEYLPVPNKSLLVIEETNVGTYMDSMIVGIIDAVRNMVGIDGTLINSSLRTKENRVVKTIALLSEYYDNFNRNIVAKKEGIVRKHIVGTRCHFSFRCVITSLTGVHDYDEIHIPWGVGVNLFNIHLINKLKKLGYSANDAVGFLYAHTQKYHPLLDQLFRELISESKDGKIPVVLQRNPSLERASAQSLFITEVKRDPAINTVSMSILIVKGFNADFDGDQLNCTLSLDNYMAEKLTALAPHKSVFDLDAPRQVSKNLSIPKTVVATIANFVSAKSIETDPVKLGKMQELFAS